MNKSLNPNSASGSATGNPRNKTALKPGFSLVGWIRLGSSGEDLTGLKGKNIPVSHQELAKHNKINDCWMAVRGKVYNVTRYLEYHPGGSDQLMRGAGKDATSLFDEYHAWVNIDQLLSKCYVGPLRNTVTLNLKDSSSNMDIRSRLSPPSSGLKFPSLLSVSSEALSKIGVLEKPESPIKVQAVEIIPRFDWIQSTSEMTIFFYTKGFCNPGVYIEYCCDKESKIKIFISNTSNTYKFTFLKSLKWPCTLKINHETGKIEIIFMKTVPALWSSFGIFERTRTKEETIYSEYIIKRKEYFNDDSFELILRPKKQALLNVPIGFHLNFQHNNAGNTVIRSYTPIPINNSNQSDTHQSDILFLIKSYANGSMTRFLNQKSIDEEIFVSEPKGNLDLNVLKNHVKIAIMAAGSGITPMISVLDHLLKGSTPRNDAVKFYLFNKTSSDIWLRKQLEQIQEKDNRFSITHILSEPADTWTGEKGRVTREIVQQIAQSSQFVFICGPAIFTELAVQYLKEYQIEMHCFQG